jgi:hypothetical protein
MAMRNKSTIEEVIAAAKGRVKNILEALEKADPEISTCKIGSPMT